MNAVEIEQAISELAEKPFDRQEFPFQFLEAFGNKDTTLKRLRTGVSNKSDLGGVLQTNNIHIATCAPGQTSATLAALRDSPATAKGKARFILATDGETLEAEDLTSDDPPIACAYPDFHDHFGFFLPLAGITTVKQIRESAFDIKATGRLNRLYVELLKDNPEWGTEALLTLRCAQDQGAIGLTKTKAFKRVFLHWALDHFDWPGKNSEEMFRRGFQADFR